MSTQLYICTVCDVMCAMSCYLYTTVTQTSVLSGVLAVNYQFKEHLNYTLPAGFLPDWSTAEPLGGKIIWPLAEEVFIGLKTREEFLCGVYISVHPWKQCQSPPSLLWAPGLLFCLGYSIKPAHMSIQLASSCVRPTHVCIWVNAGFYFWDMIMKIFLL